MQSSRPGMVTALRIVQLLIAAVILISLLIQLILLFTGGADANSGAAGTAVPVATRLVRLFSFFTIQSNVIVAAVAILLVARPLRDGPGWRVARLDSLLGITITGIVFALILAPQVHLVGWAFVATVGFHYLSPVLAVVAWLLFGPRPGMSLSTVGYAFIWPVAWLIYTFVHGAITRWYPYPFLDAAKIGWAHAILNAGIVLVVGIVLALILYAIDRRAPSLVSR